MPRVLLLLAALCACAPSQRRLLADRHYDEALAGVDEGALDGGVVLSRLAADLAPGLHIQAVPAAELRTHVGEAIATAADPATDPALTATPPTSGPAPKSPADPTGLDQFALVRAYYDSHEVSVRGYRVSIALLHAGLPAPVIDTSIEALALYTGESLPQPTVVDHPDQSRLVAVRPRSRFPGLEMIGRLAVNMMTLGLIHPVVPLVKREGTSAYSETIQPSDADYARVSPGAASLHRWLEASACDGLGERCERWLLWPRGDVERTIVVVVHPRGQGDSAIVYTLPLPPGPIDQALAARFGDRMQTLADLARAAGTAPQVTYRIPTHHESGTDHLTRRSARTLCRLIRGTPRHPGLQGRPGLRYILEFVPDAYQSDRELLAIRHAVLACGATPDQIEVVEGVGISNHLRVRHDVVD